MHNSRTAGNGSQRTGTRRKKQKSYQFLSAWLGIRHKAGFNIGGTSPIPLPKEIRKIDSYAPGIAIAIEGNATKWFDEKRKSGDLR